VTLTSLDWTIIIAFFVGSLGIGLAVAHKAGRDATEFFLSGRQMPWWLLGFSMVATTFSADTPNLVTDIVRQNGVSGNWVWWAFLLTGMLTVFVYARLWRRSGVFTDLEFYEMRYSGPEAAFLRGFRAVYLGVLFNIMIMASVLLAGIKMGAVLLDLLPWQTVVLTGLVTVLYSALGGLRGVMITDFFQFILAMIGSVAAAVVIVGLPQVGGLGEMLAQPAVASRLSLLPDFANMSWQELLPVFILPLAVQWWSVWYPGAEPGGGGYIAQRMLSAKNESHAAGATLFFNVAHYALRPWPWILIALASLLVFPTLADLQAAFPDLPAQIVKEDLAYPAMLTFLPQGLLGLVIASLIAALMSTLSTHLNWGASYVVHDVYRRFVAPEATERQLVTLGRVTTALMMVLAGVLALYLENALQAFQILLQIGAGTGLLFILRWFWWRINAWSEIAAMTVSFLVALWFEVVWVRMGWEPIAAELRLLLGIGITTVAWLAVTFLTRPTARETLLAFYDAIRPAAWGWRKVLPPEMTTAPAGQLPRQLLAMLVGSLAIYSALFAAGMWIYGRLGPAAALTVVALVGGWGVFRLWERGGN